MDNIKNIDELLKQGQSIEALIDSIGLGQLFILRTKALRGRNLFLEKMEGYNFVSYSSNGSSLILSFADFITLIRWDTDMIFIDTKDEFERYMTMEDL